MSSGSSSSPDGSLNSSASAPSSSSTASCIPKLWRNDSVAQRKQKSALQKLKSFPASPLSTRFSEDLDAAASADFKAHDFVPPRPCTPFAHEHPLGSRMGGTTIEATIYPIYMGYERRLFLTNTRIWIEKLQVLHDRYKSALESMTIITRLRLGQYRKLTRRMSHLRTSLESLHASLAKVDSDPDTLAELEDAAAAVAYFETHEEEYRVLRILLAEWIAKARHRCDQINFEDGWPRSAVVAKRTLASQRAAMFELKKFHAVLGEELKGTILERVCEVLRDSELNMGDSEEKASFEGVQASIGHAVVDKN